MKKSNDRLQMLLETKSFAELSAEDRYFVTETLAAGEYERLHFLAKNAGPALQAVPAPAPAIRANLLAAVRQRQAATPPPSAIVRALRWRIPAWQAAAAVAVLLCFHFFQKNEPETLERTVTEYVHHTDTVWREVALPAAPKPAPVPASRINVKPREVPSTPPEPAIVAQADSAARPGLRSELPDSFALQMSQPRGKSASQTEELWQFLEEVH